MSNALICVLEVYRSVINKHLHELPKWDMKIIKKKVHNKLWASIKTRGPSQ